MTDVSSDRPTVLVVEGNTDDILARREAVGASTTAQVYAAVLGGARPDLRFVIASPASDGFRAADVDLEAIDAAVFTGSGVAWAADDARAGPFHALTERLFAADVPVAGSCWGMQVAAVVLGGAVGENPVHGREIGVARAVRLTDAGAAHPVFAGKPRVFDSVCIHRDEVTRLPDGATLLAGNDHSSVQSFAYQRGGARFVGWQYHPELSLADIADFLEAGFLEAGFDADAYGDLFVDQDDAMRVLDAWRAMARDPSGLRPLRWRYGVTEHAVDPARRTLELRNWAGAIKSRHDDRDRLRRTDGCAGAESALS